MRTIALIDLIESLSAVLDFMSPALSHHQVRVAFIARHLAEAAGLDEAGRHDLALAAPLHDCGAFSLMERLEIMDFEFDLDPEKARRHAEAGYYLLRKYPPFAGMALLIRYHHLAWQNGKGAFCDGGPVPLGSHILHLADRVAVLLDYQTEVLEQISAIMKIIEANTGSLFHPGLVAHLHGLAEKESFWFGIESISARPALEKKPGVLPFQAGLDEMLGLAEIFAQLIDFRSRFTATHSSGVAACAARLAEVLAFSDSDCRAMLIAGNLHDLGKLAIPPEIINRKEPLTRTETNLLKRHSFYTHYILAGIRGLETITEWAALHHERLNGRGYPFHFKGDELSPGARVMAVADVFTATMEDRPYRKGMMPASVIGILQRMAASGVLDNEIVRLLVDNFGAINQARAAAQREAAERYQKFASLTA